MDRQKFTPEQRLEMLELTSETILKQYKEVSETFGLLLDKIDALEGRLERNMTFLLNFIKEDFPEILETNKKRNTIIENLIKDNDSDWWKQSNEEEI